MLTTFARTWVNQATYAPFKFDNCVQFCPRSQTAYLQLTITPFTWYKFGGFFRDSQLTCEYRCIYTTTDYIIIDKIFGSNLRNYITVVDNYPTSLRPKLLVWLRHHFIMEIGMSPGATEGWYGKIRFTLRIC